MEAPSGSPSIGLRRPIMHACIYGVHARMPGCAYCCVCCPCPRMHARMACMRACLDAHIVAFAMLVHASLHACIRACVNACMRSASFGPSLHRLRPLMYACLRACMACTHTCLNAHSVAFVCLIHACIDGVQARTPGRAYCGSCLSMPS